MSKSKILMSKSEEKGNVPDTRGDHRRTTNTVNALAFNSQQGGDFSDGTNSESSQNKHSWRFFWRECWPFQPWFAVEEPSCNRLLDISATFGPVTSLAFLAKFVTCGYVVVTQVMAWNATPTPLFFYAYYTNWSMLFCSIYVVLSFGNSMCEVPQPSDGTVRGRAKYTWIVFNIAIFSQFLATVAAFLNWFFVLKLSSTPDYLGIASHGLVFLVIMVDGCFIGRIPLRWMHIWLSWMVLVIFFLWSMFHQILGLVDPYSNFTYDAIYSNLSWDPNEMGQSFMRLILLFVCSPILFGILRVISVGVQGGCPSFCCCFCCRCLGSDRRRYLDPDIELGYRRAK